MSNEQCAMCNWDAKLKGDSEAKITFILQE